MDNKTTKPITLLRNEFIENVIQTCNNSGLPLFVVEDVLKDLIQEIHIAAQQQFADDKQRYEQSLKSEEEK